MLMDSKSPFLVNLYTLFRLICRVYAKSFLLLDNATNKLRLGASLFAVKFMTCMSFFNKLECMIENCFFIKPYWIRKWYNHLYLNKKYNNFMPNSRCIKAII